MVAAHMQLAMLETAGVPPLMLTPDLEEWFNQQLGAAKAALPLPPHAAVAQQQRPGSPSLRQKRKWQATGLPPGSSADQQPCVAAVSAPAQQQQPDSSAISRLPFWHHLKQALLAEKHQEVDLQEHAVLVAADTTFLPVDLSELDGSDNEACVAGTGTLRQLQQAAVTERAATERLMRLALQ